MERIYEGIFFPSADIMRLAEGIRGNEGLNRVISTPHVTTAFRPVMPSACYQVGEQVTVTVIGYGNDGRNEGVQVVIPEGKECNNAVPHITLSVSADGKPVDTGKLKFYPIKPRTIVGTFGYFNGKEVVLCK